jgi:hypothetical protein
MKGRVEEAKKVTFKLHSIKGDPDQDFARGEFYQMSKQADLDRKMEPGWVSKGHRHRHRNHNLVISSNKCPRSNFSSARRIASAVSWQWASRSLVSRQVCTLSRRSVAFNIDLFARCARPQQLWPNHLRFPWL